MSFYKWAIITENIGQLCFHEFRQPVSINAYFVAKPRQQGQLISCEMKCEKKNVQPANKYKGSLIAVPGKAHISSTQL